MGTLQFAIAILFPGVGAADIVDAAIKSQVHIIDKEDYQPGRDYAAYNDVYTPYTNGSKIMLLFVFGRSEYVLADTDEQLNKAVRQIASLEV